MKRILAFLTIAISMTANAQPPQPSKEDLTKMDFWVGNWELTWEGGKGTNLIEKKLNGRVIQENFEATEGNFKGYLGTSISTFNPVDGKWHQAWADSQGGYIDLIGIMDGDTRIFQLTTPRKLPDGKESISRMRFYDITEDSFMWDWEASTDGGRKLAAILAYQLQTGKIKLQIQDLDYWIINDRLQPNLALDDLMNSV